MLAGIPVTLDARTILFLNVKQLDPKKNQRKTKDIQDFHQAL